MYETKQKKYILDILQENSDKHLNCEEIHDLLKDKGYSVSLATLYRYLDKFVSLNYVRKYTTTHLGKACYQLIDNTCKKHNHFHLICLKCNRLIHLDCNLMNEFMEHINKHHKFKVVPEKVVYYGYCEECGGV